MELEPLQIGRELNDARVAYEKKLMALRRHSSQLGSATNIDEVVKHTLDAMEFTLGFSCADFTLVDTERRCLRFKGKRGTAPSFSELPLAGPGVTVKAANTGRTVSISDTNREEAYVDDEGRTGKDVSLARLSELAVPVVVDGTVVAVLNVENNVPNAFVDDDQKLLETLATHAASAIRRLKENEKLIESEAKYRAIVENSPNMIGIFQDGVLKYINSVVILKLGWTYEELLSPSFDPIENVVSQKSRNLLKENIGKRLRGENVALYEISLTRKDGSEVQVLVRAAKIIYNQKPAIEFVFDDITEHKRAEENLRQSEERYHSLFDDMLDGVYRSTPEGRFVDINPAFVKMFGYSSKQEMLDIIDIKKELYFSPEERGSHILDTGQEEVEVYRMRRKDGSEIWVEDHGRYDHDERGNIIYHEGILRDVTERKRAEEALRRRAEELAALQTTVLDITGRHDLPELLNGIVERAARLLGATSGGMYLCDSEKQEVRCVVGYNTAVNIVGTVIKYGEGAAGIVATTGKPLIIDDYQTWPGRAAVYEKDQPFSAVLSAPMIWQGQVTGVLHVLDNKEARHFTQADLELLTLFANHAAIAVENTRLLERLQRHSTELERVVNERTRELQESERKYRQLVENALDGIWVIDAESKTTFVNQRMADMLGYAVDEMLGVSVFRFMDEGGIKIAKQNLERRRRGVSEQLDFEFLRKDGRRVYTNLNTSAVTDEKGNYVGAMAIVRDITERKRLEEELLRVERLAAIGETATMVGHDLRNPLQGIAAAAYVLKEQLDSTTDERTKEMLQLIEDGVEYSDKIINDLLDYSGPMQLNLAETNLKSITKEALLLTKVPRNITIVDLTEEVPRLKADVARTLRVFVNLIQNAIDAMRGGGELTIRSRRSNGKVQITFTDTGAGIPEEVKENLWKPLQTTKSKGLGLGLAISKRIVEAHGGTISVESTVGKGTAFTVAIPIKPEAKEVNEA